VDEPTWASEWSSSGALGEPKTADAEAGAAVVEAYVERVVQFARRMLERGLPEDDA
jgi:creatinine amidohydrolase/Fe(II)-dependent formamide hydrolase-like protein